MAAIIAVYPNPHNCVTLRGDMNPTPENAIDHLPAGIARAISREDLANLPINRYHGTVHLVTSQHEVAQALADISQERVTGFDTETRPSFRKGEFHLPCLVQVATARAVYLFPLRHTEAFPALTELLSEARIAKAGVALADDLRTLKAVFPFHEKNMVDLGKAARSRGLEQTGVRNLAAIFMGFRIPKGARTSNWAAPRLTEAQVTYAATDAWVCRELYLRMEELKLLKAEGCSGM
jgi:ribonuclease D